MARLYSNNYSSTISTASVADVDLTFDVVSTTGLPLVGGADYVHLTITDSLSAPTKTEIIKVTNQATNTLTVERAQEGTTAQAWVTGDFIELRSTAESFNILDGTEITRYVETVNLVATATIDRADGGIQFFTFTQNETLAITIENGESLTLHLINGSLYTVTWPTIAWITGAEPPLTIADVISLWKVDNVLYAAYVGGY